MSDEFETELRLICNRLLVSCKAIDPVTTLSHEEIIATGYLTAQEIAFIENHALRLEVTQKQDGEILVRIRQADTRFWLMTKSTSVEEFFDTTFATLDREIFASVVHRIILEGANPTVIIHLPESRDLLCGKMDDQSHGTIVLLSPHSLPFQTSKRLEDIVSAEHGRTVFDAILTHQDLLSYSYHMPQQSLARCANKIVFEVLCPSAAEVEIQWCENIFGP